MDMKILESFCSQDNEKHKLTQPFSIGEFTYATDGRVMIRVVKEESVESIENPVDVTKIPWDHSELDDWHPLPNYNLEDLPQEKCKECRGHLRTSECPECSGDGFVEFENTYNCYSVDCQTCDGFGDVPDHEGDICEVCSGTGIHLRIPIAWGASHITVLYLEKIKKLPNVKMSKFGDGLEPFRFIFDGGVGLVMPYRV
ncbi:hypothetical protein MJO47_09245 [Desulfuromonas sp. KJ2020]|uniref:hypothetical protein n=1 Tax=Desulfuromonas sp. KJ2020 TaxID=2919173 RepID=UPI0020A7BF22|nr:hypothetical protein [Desulfuromonas sp. KJ2020]MCP3177282.1 hypothetical protein [Desulfuromonas sp. KJ2020]